MKLKIHNIYENLLNEAQAEGCVKMFGKQLFGPQMGGKEPNTRKEENLLNMLRDFTDNLHGAKMNPALPKGLAELRNCLSSYPEVLMPKGVVYRGIKIPLSKLLSISKSGGIDSTGQFTYDYKPTSLVQSWSEKKEIAKKFADKSKKEISDNLLKPFQEKYGSLSDVNKKKFMQAVIDNSDKILVPVLVSHVSSPQSFLFNGESFNKLSRYGGGSSEFDDFADLGYGEFDDELSGFDLPDIENIEAGESEYEVLGIGNDTLQTQSRIDPDILKFLKEFERLAK